MNTETKSFSSQIDSLFDSMMKGLFKSNQIGSKEQETTADNPDPVAEKEQETTAEDTDPVAEKEQETTADDPDPVAEKEQETTTEDTDPVAEKESAKHRAGSKNKTTRGTSDK